MSIFKKIKLFNSYKKIIRKNEFELGSKFNIRIDKADRLYTVINIPEDIVGESYSLKKSDIDRISESFIKQYSNEIGNYLSSKGLNELFTFYKIDKVSKFSYLLVFGFSLFKSQGFYNQVYYIGIPAIVLSIVALIITLLINF
jgi:hypothetical protein